MFYMTCAIVSWHSSIEELCKEGLVVFLRWPLGPWELAPTIHRIETRVYSHPIRLNSCSQAVIISTQRYFTWIKTWFGYYGKYTDLNRNNNNNNNNNNNINIYISKIIILLLTMLTIRILFTINSLKNTTPSRHYLQFHSFFFKKNP